MIDINPNRTILRDNETHVEYLYLETFGYEVRVGDELERFFSRAKNVIQLVYHLRSKNENREATFKMTKLEFHFILQQYCTMDEADKQAIRQVESKVSNLLHSSLILLSFALGIDRG